MSPSQENPVFKKIAPLAATAVLLLGGAGVAAASVAAKEPAKSYGVCVNKTSGAVRVLEAKNLAKSKHGKCRTGERRVLLPGVDGVPPAFKLPAKMQFSFEGVTAVCTRGTDAAAGVPAYACVKPSPTPTS
jgi:hypothetical protein